MVITVCEKLVLIDSMPQLSQLLLPLHHLRVGHVHRITFCTVSPMKLVM